MRRLAHIMAEHGVSQRYLAKELGISLAAVNNILTKDQWPAKDTLAIKKRMAVYLVASGLSKATALATIKTAQPATKKHEEHTMLRKQTLFPETKRAFQIIREPFGDVGQDDVFLSPSIRFVRETMYQTAKHGGLLAVVGESGSGKSTLRKDLIARLGNEDQPIKVIEPFVLGMEDNDRHGKTMRSLHVAEAILFAVAPSQKCQSSPEARFRQVYRVLKDSYRAGNRHVLIIEEAHGLSFPMIKHLKRFYELEDGFQRLLSIILIGQPELADKLDEANAEVREVVQRTEVVKVFPIEDLHGYVAHRCKAVGLDAAALFTPEALDMVPIKLSGPQGKDGKSGLSLVYPLAVGNLLTAALNAAHKLGEKTVTRDVILSL